jgi:hypothetical protein
MVQARASEKGSGKNSTQMTHRRPFVDFALTPELSAFCP